MLLPHYIRTGGFAPVWHINVSTASSGVEQRVGEITFFISLPNMFNYFKITAMDRRVKFNTTTKFELAEDELKHLYTLMALVQFPYDCDPEYRDYNMIRRLRNDFRRFNTEITKVCEADPNNLVLSQIRNFVQRHCGYLKKVSQKLEVEQ